MSVRSTRRINRRRGKSTFSKRSRSRRVNSGDSRIGNEYLWCCSESEREEKGEKEQRERLDVTKHQVEGRRCKSANKWKSTAGEAAATASARQVKAKTNASTKRRKGKKATKPQVKGRQRGENEEAEEED
jgi:hypothetical protein